MLYLNACVIAKYTWDTNKTPRTLFCTRGDAVTELRDPGYSRVWPELSVSCLDELDALRQLWTPARNRGPQRAPTQACAIRTPELLRPPRKIRDSGYSESQSEGAIVHQPANPGSRLNQGPSVRRAPPVSNQRAGNFGRTFQNSENKTNRGPLKDVMRQETVSFRLPTSSLNLAPFRIHPGMRLKSRFQSPP